MYRLIIIYNVYINSIFIYITIQYYFCFNDINSPIVVNNYSKTTHGVTIFIPGAHEIN